MNDTISFQKTVDDETTTIQGVPVKDGEVSSIEGKDAIVCPFDSAGGKGQSIRLRVSEDEVENIEYDELEGTVRFRDTTLKPGDSVSIGGRTMTIVDVKNKPNP